MNSPASQKRLLAASSTNQSKEHNNSILPAYQSKDSNSAIPANQSKDSIVSANQSKDSHSAIPANQSKEFSIVSANHGKDSPSLRTIPEIGLSQTTSGPQGNVMA